VFIRDNQLEAPKLVLSHSALNIHLNIQARENKA
jgi:hypothetical protein